MGPHGARSRNNRGIGGYVDIHAHVLPGIDDGPDDLEQSLAMARAAVSSGIATIASTPHLRPDFPDVHVHELPGRCETLRHAIESEAIPLRVVSAAEASLVWAVDASDDELVLASYGQNGTDLLIETPSSNVAGIDRLLYQLRSRGYRVTLAHPERSPSFQRDESLLERLVEQGILLEVNADSLLGSRGAKRLASRLVARGLAHALASDGHRGETWRPVTRLAEAVEVVEELVGAERARWMAQAVPQAIVEGVALPDQPRATQPRARRGRWFGFARK